MIDITGLREDKRPQSSTIVHALLDRLEAAEADALEQARLNGMGSEREAALMAKLEAAKKDRANFLVEMGRLCAQCDTLRAKIEAMERQEPVGKFTQHPSNGLWEQDGYGDNPEASPLYALPGARLGPEDVMRDAERYRYLRARDDGTAGVGCWLEAKGRVCDRGWLYGAQLDSAIDSFIELLAAAPEAKP